VFFVKSVKNKKKANFNNKEVVVYGFLLLIDIVLVIYCAKKNIVQYVKYYDKNIFIGKTREMLLGKNYVNLIITMFFNFYLLAISRYFFKKKIYKKNIVISFLVILFINLVLFYIFTKKIY